MPNVFSVFNAGTSHKLSELNNTIADLFWTCHGVFGVNKFGNDGPNLIGWQMNSICNKTVEAIVHSRANILNLTGHSRGGVLCHMIANAVSARRDSNVCQINMVVLDPVDQSKHKQTGSELQSDLINRYVMIAMENVSGTAGKFFPLQLVSSPGMTHGKLTVTMPGSHGSGTQCRTSAIGAATRGLIMWLMSAWGTLFKESLPTYPQMADLFAKIHLENPATYAKDGSIASRTISDDKSGNALHALDSRVKHKQVGVGRVDQLVNHLGGFASPQHHDHLQSGGTTGGYDFKTRQYFFNQFHAYFFRSAFPAVYERLDGKLQNQTAVDMELRQIENSYPNVAKSLSMVGAI
jgi:hypothetical protein